MQGQVLQVEGLLDPPFSQESNKVRERHRGGGRPNKHLFPGAEPPQVTRLRAIEPWAGTERKKHERGCKGMEGGGWLFMPSAQLLFFPSSKTPVRPCSQATPGRAQRTSFIRRNGEGEVDVRLLAG